MLDADAEALLSHLRTAVDKFILHRTGTNADFRSSTFRVKSDFVD